MKRLTILGVLLLAGTAGAANDFTADANVVSLYRYENGALTTDSIGTNTLTAGDSPGTSTTDYQEGAACTDLEITGTPDYFYRNDTDLSSDFPGKNGTSNKTFSVTAWFKAESLSGGNNTIVAKLSVWSQYWLRITSSKVQLSICETGAWDIYEHASTISTGQWYHVGATYNNATKAYRIRIWDANAAEILGTDKTGTGTKNMAIWTGPFTVGAGNTGGDAFDGLLDELVICGTVFTTDQIDLIRQGTYGAPPVSNSKWWERRRHSKLPDKNLWAMTTSWLDYHYRLPPRTVALDDLRNGVN